MVLKVGVVRDERYLEHKPGLIHPEHPNRLKSIYAMLDREFPGGLVRVEPELATMEQLELVHTSSYIEKVLKTAEQDFTYLAPDTPAGSNTYKAAFLAAGGCVKAIDFLLSGACDACLALVRPPGHHALPDQASGFCIFNNLAVAARYAVSKQGLTRVLIVDWDIHHGQGLQNIFYEENRVLYFSTHFMGFYPQTGPWSDVGSGGGAGYTVNIPLPREADDGDMLYVYRRVLGPIMRRYRPQLVLVAAGFDAHKEDPLGRGSLTERGFFCLSRLLKELREENNAPPLLFSLEGGYDLRALAGSVKEVIRALSTDESPFLCDGMKEGAGAKQWVERARRIHASYQVWA